MKIYKYKELRCVAEMYKLEGKNQIKFPASSNESITSIVVLCFINKFDEIYFVVVFYDSDQHYLLSEKELLERDSSEDPLLLAELTVKVEVGIIIDKTNLIELADPVFVSDNKRKGEIHTKYSYFYLLSNEEFYGAKSVLLNFERSKPEVFPARSIINGFLFGEVRFFSGHLDYLRKAISMAMDHVKSSINGKIDKQQVKRRKN